MLGISWNQFLHVCHFFPWHSPASYTSSWMRRARASSRKLNASRLSGTKKMALLINVQKETKKGRCGLRFINYHCIIMIHSSIIYHCVLYVFIYLYLFIVTVPWRQSWDFRTSTLSMDQHEHLISRIEWMSNGPNDNDCHWVILSGNST